MVKVPGTEYWWCTGRSGDFVMLPSFQSTFTDSMVTPGDPGLRFPFRVTFVPAITGSRSVRIGAFAFVTGPPGPVGTEMFTAVGNVTGMVGWTTEMFVVRVAFCPSDCSAVIERI